MSIFHRLNLSHHFAILGVISLIIVGGILAAMSRMRNQTVEQAGLTAGRAVANQVVTLRSFYTAEIASRAKKAGMQLGFDYKQKDGTLPLPATLVKALGESVAKEYPGTDVRLLSNYPFPNRADTKLDAFQAQALAALEKDPTTPRQVVEDVNGRLSVRYAVADVMKEGCVGCHNNHPQSPKRDWQVGDVRGIVEVVVPVDQIDNSISRSAMTIAALIAVSFGALGLLAVLLTRHVVRRPLHEAAQMMERVADGDLTVQPRPGSDDEVGRLFGALNSMIDKLRRTVGNVRDSAESIRVASSEVASGNANLSQRTEVSASSLQQTASSMAQITGSVSQTADSARTAHQLVSSASSAAARGGDVVTNVVSTMDDINTSSKKIADIIGVIDGIAFQTNILALNAAVEAARAGDSGRGFAVVAGEVRGLARRSADAAKEIKALIGSTVDKVEAGSRLVQDAGTTMNDIVVSVQRVSDIIGEITAAAIEQSSGIGQINAAVTQLDETTQQNAALVEQGAAAAESLKEQAQALTQVVGCFRLHDSSLTA